MSTEDRFESWAIVELMGHRKVAGRVTEEERFGSKMGRLDIPTGPDAFVTMYFMASSVYCLTVVSEAAARAAAARNQPEPVHQWELPMPEEPVRADRRRGYDEPEDPDDDDREEDEE